MAPASVSKGMTIGGVHTAVRSACAAVAIARQDCDSRVRRILHAAPAGLGLPAGKRRAVIFDAERNAHRKGL